MVREGSSELITENKRARERMSVCVRERESERPDQPRDE